jgi:hypothetical protein
MEVSSPSPGFGTIPPPLPKGRRIRRGLLLGLIAAVALLTLSYAEWQTFLVPDIVAVIPYLSLPILSLIMVIVPGNRLLGVVGLIVSGAVLYTMLQASLSFVRSC